MKDHFPNASESFKRLNPHLFGMGPIPATKPEQDHRESQGNHGGKAGRKGGLAESLPRRGKPRTLPRVTLIACRNRELDDDNLAASFKFLRDAIADSLLPGLPPGRADSYFRWECGQVETRGQEGTIVKIEI